MAANWRYALTVPSWSLTQLSGDEPVVFYTVEVRLLPPDGAGVQTRSHHVLRRFSHFQKLYLRLKELHGAPKLSSMKLPPKLPLSNVSKHPDLIDRRRSDLEQWLWRVVNDVQLSRSPLVLSFLELSEAVRVIPHAVASPAVQQSPGKASSSSSTQAQAPAGDAAKRERPPEESHIIAQHSQSLSESAKGQMKRLGFRIEQRVHLKKHTQILRDHLDRALTELKAAS